MNTTRYAKYAGIGIVAGIAAYASYTHMRELALEHGQTAMVASLLPISVDGMLVVTTMVMREDRKDGHRVRPWAWIAFVLGVAASVIANVLAAADDITSRVISAWPAVALLLVIEVLATGRKAAVLPAEVSASSSSQASATPMPTLPAPDAPTERPAREERPAILPAEVSARPKAPAKKAAAPAVPKKRPAAVVRAHAEKRLAEDPAPTKKDVAAEIGITPRRLHQVLTEPTGEQPTATPETAETSTPELAEVSA